MAAPAPQPPPPRGLDPQALFAIRDLELRAHVHLNADAEDDCILV